MNEIKIRCDCGKVAVWRYVPAMGEYYCEDCVRRGCSCNVVDYNAPDSPQRKDDKGRDYPCCEYDFRESGFDEEDNIEDFDWCVDDFYDDELVPRDFEQ